MSDIAAATVARRTRGLDRAFEILEFFRQRRQPMRPNEIATAIGAPRSTVYELTNLLLAHGMLDYHGGDGRVYLGRRLYFLGMAYADRFDLMREAEHLLVGLSERTGETAQLCLLDGDKYTVAMMHEGDRPFRISTAVGEPVPIPWTASGRLLVSHMSDAEILDFIPPDDFVLPNGDRIAPDAFLAEVRDAARVGWFTFNSAMGTFTRCFAAAVIDADGRCLATLCLITPKEEGQANRQAYLEALTGAARDLSERLGWSSPAHGALAR
jgi:DNA-binding IclR family transcriptional regulator